MRWGTCKYRTGALAAYANMKGTPQSVLTLLAVLKVMRPVLLLHMWAWPHATALRLLLPAPKAFTAASPAGPASPAFHASSAAHASPVCKAAAAAAAAVKPVLLKVVVRAPLRPARRWPAGCATVTRGALLASPTTALVAQFSFACTPSLSR